MNQIQTMKFSAGKLAMAVTFTAVALLVSLIPVGKAHAAVGYGPLYSGGGYDIKVCQQILGWGLVNVTIVASKPAGTVGDELVVSTKSVRNGRYYDFHSGRSGAWWGDVVTSTQVYGITNGGVYATVTSNGRDVNRGALVNMMFVPICP